MIFFSSAILNDLAFAFSVRFFGGAETVWIAAFVFQMGVTRSS
jgi:hypothetical protein